MSWLDPDEDLDDDFEDFDESSIRTRPNPKANRPRTKRRPAHDDAEIGRVLGVDRGRYTVMLDEDGQDERVITTTRARELRRTPIVTGDRARVVGDTSGTEGTLARIVGIVERSSLLRRSADDTDQVERIIVANADQMLIVVAAADPGRAFADPHDAGERAVVAAHVTDEVDAVAAHDARAAELTGLHRHDGDPVHQTAVAPPVDRGDQALTGVLVLGPFTGARAGTAPGPHPDVVLVQVAPTAPGTAHDRTSAHRPGKSGIVLRVVAMFSTSTPGTASPITAPEVAIRWSS